MNILLVVCARVGQVQLRPQDHHGGYQHCAERKILYVNKLLMIFNVDLLREMSSDQ